MSVNYLLLYFPNTTETTENQILSFSAQAMNNMYSVKYE